MVQLMHWFAKPAKSSKFEDLSEVGTEQKAIKHLTA